MEIWLNKVCDKRSTGKYHIIILYVTVTYQDITGSCHMIESHDKHKKVVYRLYSSYISSIQNLTETLLSFTY